jgi:UDP-N-acetylglucosamine diphosphorylase/glucosamine-1-phosphate N-acetyltransferase
MNSVIVIMAGGLGKRMNSNIPKVLHLIHNKPMIIHIIEKAIQLKPEKIYIVAGIFLPVIEHAICLYNLLNHITFIEQKNPLGTGHAIQCCKPFLQQHNNTNTIILSGDVPLIETDTIKHLLNIEKYVKVLTSYVENPSGYGRIIEVNNIFEKIVEEKDCTSNEKLINKINSGIYCFNTNILCKYIMQINNNNNQNEFYLTDIIEIIKNKENITIEQYNINEKNSYQILGVNTEEQLKQLNLL